jgi:hemerythrin-like domain-containing protein
MSYGRREFLRGSLVVSSAIPLVGAPALRGFGFERSPQEGKEEEEVAPAEDLMREHGVLNRILLIYEHYQRQLRTAKGDLDPEALHTAAGIIQHFIEDYHEKLEEDYLFPRFEKAGKLVELVRTLRAQHKAGRGVTEKVLALSKPGGLKNADDRSSVGHALAQFVRMYRPHEAREDTVLFPELHSIISAHEYAALGEQFEDKEHELFGKEGFEGVVVQVGELEKKLGIYELAQFTPRA